MKQIQHKLLLISVLFFLLNVQASAQTNIDTLDIVSELNLSKKALDNNDSLEMFSKAFRALKLAQGIKNKYYIAESYYNLADCFEDQNEDSMAIKYYNKAIDIYTFLNKNKKLASSYYSKAISYFHLENLDSSLFYHLKAFELRNKDSLNENLASSANAVGLNYWRRGNLDNAKKYYLISLKKRKETKDFDGIGMTLNALGSVYWGLGRFNTALQFYLEALQIADSLENWRRYTLIENNIGLIYQEWHQYDKALNYHLSAKEKCDTIKYHYGLAYSNINAGVCYQKLNNVKKAQRYFEAGLQNYKTEKNSIGIAYSYRILGDLYFQLNEYITAKNYYHLSINKAERIGSIHHLALAEKSLADTYLQLNNYKLATKYANKSLNHAQKGNYNDISKENYYILSKIAENKNNIQNAYFYYKKASIINDTINDNLLRNQILDLQEKYESEKKQAENNLLIEEQKATKSQLKAKNQIIAIFVISFIILAFLLIILIINRKKKLKAYKLLAISNDKISNQTQILQKTVAELKKANQYRDKVISIIGHDIKGPIGIMEGLLNIILENNISGQELTDLLIKLRDKTSSTHILIQDLFKWVKNKEVTIPYNPQKIDLGKSIENTIQLLNEGAQKKEIHIENKVNGNIYVYADQQMLETIFRNLISNAIKFTPRNGRIAVSQEEINELIEISVKDTGIGLSAKNIKKLTTKDEFHTTFGTEGEKGSGLGLQLCREFIKKNGSNLKITSTLGKGSNFSFRLKKIEPPKSLIG